MAFINWGEETPEQKEIRRRMEEDMMFEQMAYSAATAAAAAAAGSGKITYPPALESIGHVDWVDVAPAGSGSDGDDSADFDEWITDSFEPFTGVRRLRITCDFAYAHVHEDFRYSDLSISLFNDDTQTWKKVWRHRLANPNYHNTDSDDYSMEHVDVTFGEMSNVSKIKVSSSPAIDNTYHSWDDETLRFNFYK